MVDPREGISHEPMLEQTQHDVRNMTKPMTWKSTPVPWANARDGGPVAMQAEASW